MTDHTPVDEDAMLALAHQRALRRLADQSPDPVLREMAREVLAGRLTPREVATSSLYAEALINATQKFTTWRESASEEEFEQAAEHGRTTLAELAEQPPDRPPARRSRRAVDKPDEDSFEDESHLRRD
jgi:hypothetical protein